MNKKNRKLKNDITLCNGSFPYFSSLLQYFLQLADTVGAKKLSANWRCPTFGKFFNIGINFENKAFFYISSRCSWVD